MRHATRFTTSLLIGLLAAGALHGADPLKAGVATADITPPAGMRMSGYFNERLSTGVHDPLQAKAIALVQGNEKAALVVCDLIGVPAKISRAARELAEKKTGIPADHIVVACTHSHTGPLYFGSLRKHLHDQAVARLGDDPAEKFDFPAHMIEGVADAVAKAAEHARPVKLTAGKGEETRISFNRRFHMKDGTVRFNPGIRNPDIVRVAGPIDPDVGLIFFHDAAAKDMGSPFASLTVFAMHLDTVSGTLYSADYPFHLESMLRERFGREFTSVFGTSTCGDINHINVQAESRLSGQPESRRLGTLLGESVLKTVDKLRAQEKPMLAVRRGIVEVPLQEYPPDRVKQAAADMAKIGTRELGFLEQVEANKITDLQVSYAGTTLPIEVQVIRVSDETAIVALPGEVFVELGLAIKEASPFANTLVIELCNDCPAYIPTKKAFAEGSYETVNSRVQSGGGEAMVELAGKLLGELKP
jgi:neutral/alkaline ceramidase-like enzyme